MDRITRFSLRNATAVVLIAAMLIAGGLWSAGQLKRETMPDIAIPYVIVTTIYPGAAPADVHDQVTEPLEEVLGGVEGIKLVRTQSGESYSLAIAEFGFSQDMDVAEQDVTKAIQSVELPEGALASTVDRIGFNSAPIVRLAISAPDESADELLGTARDVVIPALQGIEGVGRASLAVDQPSRLKIVFDKEALEDEGLTADSVVQQLQAANLSFPVGALEQEETNQPVRVSGVLGDADALEDFQVAVYPNQSALMGEAFAAIGDGMGQMGSAIGGLAQGMGEGFSALGSGVGALGAATGEVGAQAGLINGVQQVQSQMYALKYDTLPQLKAAASAMPTGTPEAEAVAAQIAQIEGQALPGMQAAIDDMQGEITSSQKRLRASASSQDSAGSGGVMSGSASMAAPSGASSDASLPEAEIALVRLGDVAEVVEVTGDGSTSRANGSTAALIDIVKTTEGNTVDVARAVEAEMANLQSELPDGAKSTTVYDASTAINASISGMVREGALGALFAVVIILLFLRNWRATIIAAVSIPLSVLGALLFIGRFDVTMNVMTLGGLTVAIGRVVDDSIVVIENIYRHLQDGAPRTLETVRAATSEVSGAITWSTLATVAVFVPLGLVTGIIGKIFQPFALTVGLALMTSLLVAVTVVPLMARWMLLHRPLPAGHVDDARSMGWYRRALTWSLDHGAVVLMAAAALLVGSLALVPIIGTGFVPESAEKYLSIEITHPEGTKPAFTDATVREVERIVDAQPEVEFYQATVGGTNAFSMSGSSGGSNRGTVFVKLDKETDTEALLERLRKQSAPLETDGVHVVFQRVDSTGSNSELEIVLSGRDFDDIETAARTIETKLASSPGLENVESNLSEGAPQLVVDVDQEKASAYGLNAAMVAGSVRAFVAEQDVTTVKEDGKETTIVYAMGASDGDKIAQVKKLKLATPLGKSVKLSKLARVEETASPVAVLTRDGNQSVSVTGRITERDSGSVISAVETEIGALDLPEGVEWELSGAAEQMSESFAQLGMAMLVAVAAVFLVLMLAFGEATAALAIMFSLPVGVVGGLVGLLIAGVPLDVPAMIGALMLIGIVVTNAVVLVERVQQRLAQGFDRREALLDAGATRMRPILMTAATTVIALVPLAIGFGEGTLISQSLAVIVIGGLTTSTLLTLVVVPVAYDVLEGAKEWLLRKRQPEPDAVEA